MTHVDDVVAAATQLSPDEQLYVLEMLSASLARQYRTERTAPRRVIGLHDGKIVMAADFDQELPDSFWLGEDDVPAA